MEKNVSGKWIVFAYGLPDHANDGQPITGDAANITANVRIDGGAANAVDDVNPTELEDGYYIFDITATEVNGDNILLTPVSSTANVQVIAVPGALWTRPPNFNGLGIEVDGDVTKCNLVATTTNNTDMRGTDSANTVVPDAAGTAPTAIENRQEMDSNSTMLAAIAGYIDTEIASLLSGQTSISAAISALNNLTAAQVNTEVDTAIADFWTSPATLVALIWNEVLSKANYNVGQSAAKVLRQSGDLIQISGAISDVSPTTTGFNTDLTQIDGYFNDAIMVFVNGAANAGIGKPVSTYLNTGGAVTFVSDLTWPVTPINGDDFVIISLHEHPLLEIADAFLDRDMSSGTDSGSATVRTVRQALRANRNKVAIVANSPNSSGAMTVYKEDDSTVSHSAVTQHTAGNPLSEIDPAS